MKQCKICKSKKAVFPKDGPEYCRECWDKRINALDTQRSKFQVDRYMRTESTEVYFLRHPEAEDYPSGVNAAKINAIFRCAAIGQLYGWEIAQSILGFKEYYLDPSYDLYSVRCVHTCDGWWPLIHRTKESEAFWDMVASLWPISPEICILYQDIEYSQGLDKLFEAYQYYWPQWYQYGKKWKGAEGKQNIGGGFRANALITLLAFFKLKSQKTLYKWYQAANPDYRMKDKFQWDGWREFPLAMILRMGKNAQ